MIRPLAVLLPKHLLPDTLLGRTVLVLLLGLLLSQLAGLGLFELNRSEFALHLGSQQMVDRIAGAVRLIQSTPRADRHRLLGVMDGEGLRVGWGQRPLVREEASSGPGVVIGNALRGLLPGLSILVGPLGPPLRREVGGWRDLGAVGPHPDHGLRQELEPPPRREAWRDLAAAGPHPDHGLRLDLEPRPLSLTDPEAELEAPLGRPSGPAPGAGLRPLGPPSARVSVQLDDDGSWLNFVAPLAPGEPLWRPSFVGPLGGGLLVVMALSVLAVRRAVLQLRLLAAAAERLGRDVGAPPVPVNGPREVRAVAQAFNEMQTRLRRFVDDRTQMVAAISHDLRTPITRLRLRAEFVDDDEQRDKMLADLQDMEAMIAATLAFARDDAAREDRRPTDLAALLAELCADLGAIYDGPESLEILAGALALKRAFTNLLDNARKYAGEAVVTLSEQPGVGLMVLVEDRGPGIPEAELDRVFTPFYRVESSRNRETGGTGLGLSVARSAIRAHGGDLYLENRPDGGLRAVVCLPG